MRRSRGREGGRGAANRGLKGTDGGNTGKSAQGRAQDQGSGFQGTGRAAQDTEELGELALSLPPADQLGLHRIMEWFGLEWTLKIIWF